MAALIVALDYPEAKPALEMAEKLKGSGVWVKIGLELFTKEGTSIVSQIREKELSVMLDLKFHDIPNTVQGAVRSACSLGVELMTIHLAGGERMAKAAMQGAEEGARLYGVPRPKLFGVTVLTSMAEGDLIGWQGSLGLLALELAEKASEWGLDGVVCSGHEVASIKEHCPNLLALTPGIRPASQNRSDDQRRTMTPFEAVQAGSDYLVVGRPITKAEDSYLAAQSILDEMQGKTQ